MKMGAVAYNFLAHLRMLFEPPSQSPGYGPRRYIIAMIIDVNKGCRKYYAYSGYHP